MACMRSRYNNRFQSPSVFRHWSCRRASVSNVTVWRYRSLRRGLAFLLLLTMGILLLMVFASRVEQHLYRRRVESLHSDIQSIELGKTSWAEARARFAHWDRSMRFDSPCDSHACSVTIEIPEAVFAYFSSRNLFIKLDDYFRWRLKLAYAVGPFERLELTLLEAYVRAGGHPANANARVGMIDGVVRSTGFFLEIQTYGHPAYWSGDFRLLFPLMAEFKSIDRFDTSNHFSIYHPSRKHPEYLIGRPSGCTICVLGWVRFTSHANLADVHRLMKLDFSCLTRWRACTSQADIMPSAWSQYLDETSEHW
jgi:hypothetical protein